MTVVNVDVPEGGGGGGLGFRGVGAIQHKVDWEAATVKHVETNHSRRKTIEALHIHLQRETSNLDCGRTLYQLIKIYGSKRPGYRLLMNSSGCAIAQ